MSLLSFWLGKSNPSGRSIMILSSSSSSSSLSALETIRSRLDGLALPMTAKGAFSL